MSRLHEKDEPVPWLADTTIRELRAIIGHAADEFLTRVFKRQPDFGVVRCDSCGRWQDFPPPHTFQEMRSAARAAGWRRHVEDDLCPICAGN